MTSVKVLVKTTKWSTGSKIPDFKMAVNHNDVHFHIWNQNSNAGNLYIIGKEILSGLILS